MTIQELEDYFKVKDLPQEFYLHPSVKIVDVPKFVKTQMLQIRAQGVKTPSYDRLMEFIIKFKEKAE
ncbi:hypothetical protein WG906_09740 [Pedobacter sp. P351]|uniref:DUF6965 family protein n=1 Tax=Pedobacter superstes TaxID=3133441 RepID=UPI0030B75C4B